MPNCRYKRTWDLRGFLVRLYLVYWLYVTMPSVVLLDSICAKFRYLCALFACSHSPKSNPITKDILLLFGLMVNAHNSLSPVSRFLFLDNHTEFVSHFVSFSFVFRFLRFLLWRISLFITSLSLWTCSCTKLFTSVEFFTMLTIDTNRCWCQFSRVS